MASRLLSRLGTTSLFVLGARFAPRLNSDGQAKVPAKGLQGEPPVPSTKALPLKDDLLSKLMAEAIAIRTKTPVAAGKEVPVAPGYSSSRDVPSTARNSIALVAEGRAAHLPALVNVLRHEGIADAGTCVACLDALVEFTGGSGIRKDREEALTRLGASYVDRANAVIASGAPSAVCAVLIAHAQLIDVAMSGCKALRNVAFTVEGAASLFDASAMPSALEALLTVLRAQSTNARAVNLAIIALRSIIWHYDAGQDAAVAAGAPAATLSALRAHASDATLVEDCILLLAEMTQGPASQQLMAHLGAPAAIVAAIQAHSSNEGIARYGCMALYRMSLTVSGQQALIDAEAPAAVIAAMRRHAGDANVAEHGCRVLSQVALHLAGKKASVKLDAPVVLLALMRLHSASSADVTMWGTAALGTISEAYPEGQLAVVEAGAVLPIVDALRMHPTSRDVAWAACAAVLTLTEGLAAGQEDAVRARAPAAIVTAIRSFSSDAAVAQVACQALAQIALAENGARVAVSAGAPAVVAGALLDHGKTVGVAINACWALCAMKSAPVDAAPAIVAAMSAHLGVEDVARLG